MKNCNIGLLGLGVMGQSLALNMASHGYKVAVYNKTVSKVDDFINNGAKGNDNIIPTRSMEEFIEALETPKKIFLMVKAGEPVDILIDQIVPMIRPGDIIMDGGNSYYKDTMRRCQKLMETGILYLGVGVSGGEEGALRGPSIMPGGDKRAYDEVERILVDISAKVQNDIPCCNYIGSDGAGHYVKMVHNGIEYSDMQLISETYFLMKNLLKLDNDEMQEIYSSWNTGDLDSYLMEITSDIFRKKDSLTENYLVDMILDKAEQKGTGKWTSMDALDMGISVPSIIESVLARYISGAKEERVQASKHLEGPPAIFNGDKRAFIEDVRKSLYASKICSYAQGFSMLKAASDKYNWNLAFGEIALLWRGGCIIRARFLNRIKEAFDRKPDLQNLLLDEFFAAVIKESQESWRRTISTAVLNGIPVPGLSSALNYYDSYRSAALPANLIQAQRDYFGAHTYERIDRPGIFHTDWLEENK